jgi:hypothetical protein
VDDQDRLVLYWGRGTRCSEEAGVVKGLLGPAPAAGTAGRREVAATAGAAGAEVPASPEAVAT